MLRCILKSSIASRVALLFVSRKLLTFYITPEVAPCGTRAAAIAGSFGLCRKQIAGNLRNEGKTVLEETAADALQLLPFLDVQVSYGRAISRYAKGGSNPTSLGGWQAVSMKSEHTADPRHTSIVAQTIRSLVFLSASLHRETRR